jgi:hypothetical protein
MDTHRCQARVSQENLLFEPVQLGRRFDAKLFADRARVHLERLEQVCLSTGAVESGHEKTHGPFPQWVFTGDPDELSDGIPVESRSEVGIDPIFRGDESNLFESCDLGLRRRG